jgi:hypothetical protein
MIWLESLMIFSVEDVPSRIWITGRDGRCKEFYKIAEPSLRFCNAPAGAVSNQENHQRKSLCEEGVLLRLNP